MTLAGKILVFANLMLSLGMAAWAMGLYTQRVNWTNTSTPEAGPGELKKREDRITELSREVAIAERRHAEAKGRLADQHVHRTINNEQYRGYVDQITGTFINGQLQRPNDQTQVPTLVNGQTVPYGPKNPQLPQMEPAKDRTGAPLRSYFAYVIKLYETQQLIEAQSVNLAKANKDAEDRTEIIVLKPALRQLLENEQAKIARIEAEKERLKPLLVNSYVEIQLLVKRYEQLKQQVEKSKVKGNE